MKSKFHMRYKLPHTDRCDWCGNLFGDHFHPHLIPVNDVTLIVCDECRETYYEDNKNKFIKDIQIIVSSNLSVLFVQNYNYLTISKSEIGQEEH